MKCNLTGTKVEKGIGTRVEKGIVGPDLRPLHEVRFVSFPGIENYTQCLLIVDVSD